MGRLADALQMLYGAGGAPYPFFEFNGSLFLYLEDAPLNLGDSLFRWLDIQPDLMDSAPECALLHGPRGYAITKERWLRFLAWAHGVLDGELKELYAPFEKPEAPDPSSS